MSLEQSIEKLDATIQQLIKQLEAARQAQGAVHHCNGGCHTGNAQPGEGQPETTKTVAEAKSSSSGATNSAAQSTAQPDSGASAQQVGLSYDKDIVPQFSKLVNANRAKAKELMLSYKPDAKRLQDAIKPEQYAEVLAKINKLLEV